MENVQIGEKLAIILKDLSELEKDKLMLWSTIYTRKAEDIKIKKIAELKKNLEEQINFYRRDNSKYKTKIDNYVNEYTSEILRIIEVYNSYYIYLQNEIVLAQSNQKIAIANLLASKRGWVKAKENENIVLIEKSNKKIFATAQKKLNYDVVINECNMRLQKCMEEALNSINEIFKIKSNQLEKVTNNGCFYKIKKFFNITFYGDKNIEKYVLNPIEKEMKDIELQTVSKISDVKTEMLIFISQMEKIRKDINLSFNETLNKN